MSSLRQHLVDELAKRGVTSETFLDSLAGAVKGEMTETTYKWNKAGDRYIAKQVVTTTPESLMKAAILQAKILGLDDDVASVEHMDEAAKKLLKEDPNAGSSFGREPNREIVQTK